LNLPLIDSAHEKSSGFSFYLTGFFDCNTGLQTTYLLSFFGLNSDLL